MTTQAKAELAPLRELLRRLHADQQEEPERTRRARSARQALEDLQTAQARLRDAQRRVAVLQTPIARLLLALFGEQSRRDEARVAYDAALAAILHAGAGHQQTADAVDAHRQEDFARTAMRVLATLDPAAASVLPAQLAHPLHRLVLDARSSDVKTTLPRLLDAVEAGLATGTVPPDLLDELRAMDRIACHVVSFGSEPLSPLVAAVEDLQRGALTPTTRLHARKRIRWLRTDVAALQPDAILQRLRELDLERRLSSALGEAAGEG